MHRHVFLELGGTLVDTYPALDAAFADVIRRHGLALEADDLISTADGYPRKPDPAMYLAMLERHGLDPALCLSVGDRAIDAEAAAGLATATVESRDRADHSVATLDELRPLLALSAS